MAANGPKVAIFGTNRVRPVFIYFEGPTVDFENQLKVKIDEATAKKQNHIMVDAQSGFFLDDFYEKGVYNPYRRMRILHLHEFVAVLKYKKTFFTK